MQEYINVVSIFWLVIGGIGGFIAGFLLALAIYPQREMERKIENEGEEDFEWEVDDIMRESEDDFEKEIERGPFRR